MIDLFVEGGYPMWLLLTAALAALAAAGNFAARPSRQRLALTRALGSTTLASILTGTAADIAAVGHHAPEYLAHHPGESMASEPASELLVEYAEHAGIAAAEEDRVAGRGAQSVDQVALEHAPGRSLRQPDPAPLRLVSTPHEHGARAAASAATQRLRRHRRARVPHPRNRAPSLSHGRLQSSAPVRVAA